MLTCLPNGVASTLVPSASLIFCDGQPAAIGPRLYVNVGYAIALSVIDSWEFKEKEAIFGKILWARRGISVGRGGGGGGSIQNRTRSGKKEECTGIHPGSLGGTEVEEEGFIRNHKRARGC